ncbi:flavodoxin family protein [Actinomadura sp. SCN-SB]|uniref:flavodoxin family protein n=1 Tax=Actinomadura sp. SCN-SB TaxID=3373092 RepID=UPI003753E208
MRAVVIYEPGCEGTRRIAEAVAEGLPAYPVSVLPAEDATATDIEQADLVVLDGMADRSLLHRVGAHAWRGRRVAVFDTGDHVRDRPMWPSAAGRMVWWLRIRGVASPVPQARFDLKGGAGEPGDGEEDRARSWGRSLPIAAHVG